MTVTFLLGALSVVPAIFLELAFADALRPRETSWLGIFIYFLIGVALIEESLKFISVRAYAYKSPLFDEPMDGIVLGACAGLGFATIENLGYVFQFGPVDAVIRAVISVPGHAFYGAIIGYYLGEAKFRKRPSIGVIGLAIAVLLHGLFDTVATIFSNLIGVAILFGMILVVYYGIVRKEVRTAEKESPHKPVFHSEDG
jgi:RsiW-degrading membrane proteinase PrsW (M82 family)